MNTQRFALWLLLTTLLLAACQSGSTGTSTDADDNQPGSEDDAEPAALTDDLFLVAAVGDFSNEHRCSRGFDLGFVDLDAAAQTPTMNADFSAGTLGQEGAEALVGSIFSAEDTFCGADLPAETQEKLEQLDQLIEDGNLSAARDLVEELLEELRTETGMGKPLRVRASLSPQLNKDQTYHFVKTFLSIAARAQVLGMDALANEAIAEARGTFGEYAEAVLESSTDIRELISIAAQAQLLGLLDGLDEEAIAKAGELAEAKVQDLLSSFNPCEATTDQIAEMLSALALAQALGADSSLSFEVQEVFETARENNKAKAEGESIPECEGAWIVGVKSERSGLAIDFSVRSCDGISWQGVHTQKGNMLGGAAIIDLSAEFDFTVPDAGQSSTIISEVISYDSAGTWIVAGGGDSVAATISNTFSFSMELDRINSSAIVSTGGTMTLEGQSVPFPQLFGPGENVPAQVSVNEACAN